MAKVELELLRANRVDSQGDEFTETALKAVAERYAKNPSILKFVTRGFQSNKACGQITNLFYRDGALWVQLDAEAADVAKSEGLEAAAGGYMKSDPGEEGVRVCREFNLDRVALVKDEI